MAGYAELHCHSHFSFLDGASAPDDLVERAVELGMTGLAVTDHNGLYGAVRFVSAAEAAGLHPVVGLEIELLDLGDATIETKQYGTYPIYFDSIYILGERQH